MAAQCIASRLSEFLHRRDGGEIVDRIRREVVNDTPPNDRLRLRPEDWLLHTQQPRIFSTGESTPESYVIGSYRLLTPEEAVERTPPEQKKEAKQDADLHG
jgi:hypothetical protein